MAHKRSSSSANAEEDSILETEVSKKFINFFVDELRDVYWAEKHQAKALTKMSKAATAISLKEAFRHQLVNIHTQTERLEQVFEGVHETPKAHKSGSIADMLEEAEHVIDETIKGTAIRDAALVLTVRKIIHYKIAGYGSLVQLARTMGNEDIIALLEQALTEENEAAEMWTAVAEKSIGLAAINPQKESEKVNEKNVTVYDSVNLENKIAKN